MRIGSDTGVYHGTFFDLGPAGEVRIGNYCTLVGAVINTNSLVHIADFSFVAHEVTFADSFAAIPWQPDPSLLLEESRENRQPTISLGENCWIGARATLLSGAYVGEGAIVGAGAVVDFEVPPFAIVAGNPARIVGWTEQQRARVAA